MGVLAAVNGGAAERIVRVVLVEPIIFIKHRNPWSLDGRNIAEGVPHYLKVVVHLAAAAHKEALGNILSSVTAAACQIKLFKQMNVLAFHLAVTDKIKGGGQSRKSRAYNVSRFFINILRLFGMSERFISSCRVIHNENLLCFFFMLTLYPFCIG